MTYFRLLPHAGQTLHRVLDYSIFIVVIIIFFVKAIRAPRVNKERYVVILVSMVAIGLWQTSYIFSRTPMDRSMIGYGVFGLLVYYFSLHYRAMRLLDRMLAAIASQLPEALFFFDSSGQCIWVNNQGIELVGLGEAGFDQAPELLDALFGELDAADEWTDVRTTSSGEAMRSFEMQRHAISDEKGRVVGSFLSVRDNSDEQRTIQRSMYDAAHDSLTKVYNRAGYELLLS